MLQLSLLPNRGGRPRGRKTVSHDKRPAFAKRFPQHVTMRTVAGAPVLGREYLLPIIRRAIRESHKPTFAICEFNVLGNHLHLVVEAAGAESLSRGMQGLTIRLARRLNAKLKRTGKLFATRYHARSLQTPREVRNTLRYVLCNRKHHAPAARFDRYWVDPCSSAPWFAGWAEPLRREVDLAREAAPTQPPSTWLLRVGWRAHHGPLAFDERPT